MVWSRRAASWAASGHGVRLGLGWCPDGLAGRDDEELEGAAHGGTLKKMEARRLASLHRGSPAGHRALGPRASLMGRVKRRGGEQWGQGDDSEFFARPGEPCFRQAQCMDRTRGESCGLDKHATTWRRRRSAQDKLGERGVCQNALDGNLTRKRSSPSRKR